LRQGILQAARDGQTEFRLMDAMGIPGQRAASGVARGGGDAGAEIAEYLANRQAGQSERVSEYIAEAFGFRGRGPGIMADPDAPGSILSGSTRSAQETQKMLEAARGRVADLAYDAARKNAQPVDVRSVVEVIDARLGPTRGNEFARDGIDGQFQKYRDRLVKQTADGQVELSDFSRVLNLKQDLQTEMQGLIGTPAYRELKKIESALDEVLEAASPAYRKANDDFREASRVIDAIEAGQMMSKPGQRAVDNLGLFDRMTPDQQQAARIGYGDGLLAQVERQAAPTANNARPLRSPKRVQETEGMAMNAELFRRRIERENTMWETQNRALGGSRTADNIADQGEIAKNAAGVAGAARSAANIQIGDAVSQIAAVLGPVARGENEATRQLIARALMSKNPQEALEPILRQYNANLMQRRLAEAIVRGASREYSSEALGLRSQ